MDYNEFDPGPSTAGRDFMLFLIAAAIGTLAWRMLG